MVIEDFMQNSLPAPTPTLFFLGPGGEENAFHLLKHYYSYTSSSHCPHLPDDFSFALIFWLIVYVSLFGLHFGSF